MAEAEGIPPTASVASVGPGIHYIGNFVYAYSGEINVANVEFDLLDFVTGSGFIVGDVEFNMVSLAGDDYVYYIYLNELKAQGYNVQLHDRRSKPDTWLRILIPPFTRVRCTALNVSDSSSNAQLVSLTGRVYDA